MTEPRVRAVGRRMQATHHRDSGGNDSAAPANPGWSWATVAKVHTNIALAAAVTIAAVLQVFAVGRGDPDVIRAILTYMDAPKAVLSLVLALLPVLIGTFAYYAWMIWIGQRSDVGNQSAAPVLAVVATVLAMIFAPIWFVVVFAAIGLLLVAVLVIWPWPRRRVRVRRGGKPTPRAISSLPVSTLGGSTQRTWVLVALLVYLPFTFAEFFDQPWVTSEVITVQDSSKESGWIHGVGYVVGSSGRSIVVLWDDPRNVWVIPDTDVDYRQPCATGSDIGGPSVFQTSAGGGLPSCSSVLSEVTLIYNERGPDGEEKPVESPRTPTPTPAR